MIGRSLLAATLASGMVFPAKPSVLKPAGPAIVKADNLELSRHLLFGMPLTMGMLGQKASPYADIIFVGGVFGSNIASGANVSLTALTGGIATSAAQNDIVIVFLHQISASSDIDVTLTTPTGYTELADLYANGPTYDTNLGVYWKRMGATPDTSLTASASSSYFAVGVYRNVDVATALDATTTTATGTGTGLPNPPAITTVTDKALVVVGFGANSRSSGVQTTPSGYGNSIVSGTNCAVGQCSKVISTAGPEDPALWANWTPASGSSWAAASIALRPKLN